MPASRSAATVFIHGLARKPAPEKVKGIWLWGLSRDNLMLSVFAPPNVGFGFQSPGPRAKAPS